MRGRSFRCERAKAIGRLALLVLIVGYPTAALADAQPQSAGQTIADVSRSSGWVSLEPEKGNMVVIPAVVNGRPVRALLDTGSPEMAIDLRLANDLKLPLRPMGTGLSTGGDAFFYEVSNVRIGVGTLSDLGGGRVRAVDLSSFDALMGRIDVIIGLSALRALPVTIDWDRWSVRFGEGLKTGGNISKSGSIILKVVSERLLAEGRIHKTRTIFAIDTGSDTGVSVRVGQRARTGFRQTSDMEVQGLGGTAIEAIGRIPEIGLGSLTETDVRATEQNLDWVGVEDVTAVLGMGFLAQTNFEIDLAKGVMRRWPRATRMAEPPRSRSGIQGPYADGAVKVAHVMANSPAESAGLKAGDSICRLNDQEMTPAVANSGWGRGAPGTKLKLGLCSGKVINLVLKEFY